MKFIYKMFGLLIALVVVGLVFFKPEIMPEEYVVITDEKSFKIEELIDKQGISKKFSYEIPVFKEIQANNIVSISIVNFTNEHLQEIKKINMVKGKFFSKNDEGQNHCLISEATANIYFKNSESAIDKNINIGGRDYQIVGIYKSEPNNKNAMYLYLSKNSNIGDVSGIKSIYLKIKKSPSYDEQIKGFLQLFNRKQENVTIEKK